MTFFSFCFSDFFSRETYTQHGIIYYAEEADILVSSKFGSKSFPAKVSALVFTVEHGVFLFSWRAVAS